MSSPPYQMGGPYGVEGQFFICATCGKSVPISQIEGQCVCGSKVCKTCGKLYPLCVRCGWVICRNCAYLSQADQKYYHRQHAPSACLIVTACVGNTLSKEVRYLRTVRNQTVLETISGRNLMRFFNIIYYSFSPKVALFLETHGKHRYVARTFLVSPLLQSLVASERCSRLIKNKELRTIILAWLSFINFTIGLVFWRAVPFRMTFPDIDS